MIPFMLFKSKAFISLLPLFICSQPRKIQRIISFKQMKKTGNHYHIHCIRHNECLDADGLTLPATISDGHIEWRKNGKLYRNDKSSDRIKWYICRRYQNINITEKNLKLSNSIHPAIIEKYGRKITGHWYKNNKLLIIKATKYEYGVDKLGIKI